MGPDPLGPTSPRRVALQGLCVQVLQPARPHHPSYLGLWKHCPALFPAHPGIRPQPKVYLGLDEKPDIQVQHSTFVLFVTLVKP